MPRSKWPFIADHITNDGLTSPEGSPLQKLNGVGIISNVHLQGIQNSICANLKHPTTIVEFSPDGEPVRTDSGVSYHSLRKPCVEFRNCSAQAYCFESDDVHALLLKDHIDDTDKTDIEKFFFKEPFKPGYRKSLGSFIEFGEAKDRIYLHYDCPILGYREVLLPVIFEGKVLAVFFLGELFLKSREQEIHRIRKMFFENHSSCCLISDCEDRINAKECGKLTNKVTEGHNAFYEDGKNILPDEKYPQLIENAIIEIEQLEKRLEEQMRIYRENHIMNVLNTAGRKFREELPKNFPNNEYTLDDLWLNLEKRLDVLVNEFNLQYIVVFSINDFFRGEQNVLKPVAIAGSLPEEREDIVSSWFFDLKDVSPECRESSPTSSLEYPDLFSCLKGWHGNFNPFYYLIRIYPVNFLKFDSTVVLQGYGERIRLDSPINTLGGFLDITLQSFYATVLSTLSALHAASSKTSMEKALRIWGHEIHQLIPSLDGETKLLLGDSRNEFKPSEIKRKNFEGFIDGYKSQMNLMDKKVKLIVFDTFEVKKQYFKIYGCLMYRLEHAYRHDATLKKLEFVIVPHADNLDSNDKLRPPVYADPSLIEQLMYNLLNNAVKYCHRGTVIQIDCKKLKDSPLEPHILTVVNYGREMKNDESLFNDNTRGDNVEGIEGLGIGLYHSRKIINIHGGEITSQCEKVSDFDVPLIEPWLKTASSMHKKNITLQDILKAELDRLKQSGELSDIISRDNMKRTLYNPSSLETQVGIIRPTYRVKITVTIPSEEV